MFQERLTHPLCDAAVNLAVDDHGIDDVAKVVDCHEIHQLYDAGRLVDLYLRYVGAGRIGKVLRIVEGLLR